MSTKKNWIELLTLKSIEDKAINLTINNIPINECKKVKREMCCEFICNCGQKGDKNIRQIIKVSGLFCKKCTLKIRFDKAEKTNLERYGVKNPGQSQEIKEKMKATNLQKYGVRYTLQSQGVKNKIKQTCLERYGVNYTLQSKEVRDKIIATNLKKFGVENPFQSQEIKDIIKDTTLKKYGVEHPLQSQEVKDKMKATNFDKYGVEYSLQSQEVRDKIKATNLKKYGVENPFQSQEIKDKMKATCLKKFGIENPSQLPEIKEKIKETCLERYGVEYSLQSKEVRNKIIATNLKRYGVEHALQSSIIKKKKIKTCMIKYGVEYAIQNKEVFERNQKARWKLKPYTFKTEVLIYCQGYEIYALKDLEENHNYTYGDYINWNELEFWYKTKNNKKHRYYPDIPFLKENKIIEVKSDYTFYTNIYVNLLKAKCVLEKGYDFTFWIYDKDKYLLTIDSKLIMNKIRVNNELGTFKVIN